MVANDSCAIRDLRTEFGPDASLRRYFTFADEAARERGVQLRVRTDFDRLLEIREQHSESFPRVSPIFDPTSNILTPRSAFWI